MIHTEKLKNSIKKKLRKISKNFSPQQIDDAHSKAIVVWLNSPPQKNEDWCVYRIEQWLFTTALRILLYENKKRKPLLFVPSQLKGKKNENEDYWAYIPHPDSTQGSLCEDIEVLPEIYKVVMVLHYIEGYSLEEIAVKTDCTSAAIRQRHKRALAMLRKILGVPPPLNVPKSPRKRHEKYLFFFVTFEAKKYSLYCRRVQHFNSLPSMPKNFVLFALGCCVVAPLSAPPTLTGNNGKDRIEFGMNIFF